MLSFVKTGTVILKKKSLLKVVTGFFFLLHNLIKGIQDSISEQILNPIV